MSGIAVDPVWSFVVRVALSFVLLRAALHKLRDLPAFRAVLGRYRLLPAAAVDAASVVLVVCEGALALGLWTAAAAPSAALAGGLFFAYGVAMMVNLQRGRPIDCGCGSPNAPQTIGAGLVLRNVLLVMLAANLSLPQASRSLLWVDVVTITGGGGTLVLLYLAAEGLLAEASKRRQPSPPHARTQEAASA